MLKPFFASSRKSRLLSVLLLACIVTAGWSLIPEGRSQLAAPRTVSVDSLSPLLTRLKQQQDEMIANQTKIEAQTAALKEELRLAKIYSARAGGAHH